MNFQSFIVLFLVGIAIGFLVGVKSCNHETLVQSEPVKVELHDTTIVKLPAKNIVGKPNNFQVIDTNAKVDTAIVKELLARIDSLIKNAGVRKFVACFDTVAQDSFHICYDLGDHSFMARIGFAPRMFIHDTTFQVFPQRNNAFFSWHPVAGVEWSEGYAAVGGVAASVWILEGAAVLSIGKTVVPRVSVMARF